MEEDLNDLRLRGLLAAVLAVNADLGLAVVLEKIVSTACGLVGAHYGALRRRRPRSAQLVGVRDLRHHR